MLSSLNLVPTVNNPDSISAFKDNVAQNEKACRGRRCGRLFEKNRKATGRRSVAVPTDVPGRRSGPSETEALREEVHCFDWLIIHRPRLFHIVYAALQLCKKYKPERLTVE